MSTVRYEALRDRCFNELGISSEDIGTATCLDLFGSVLETYSRFRGLRKHRIITKQEGVREYELQASEFHLVDVLWNEIYPSDRFLNTYVYSSNSEEFHHPSLRIIDLWKTKMQDDLADEVVQDWQDVCDADDKRYVVIDSDPQTNIIIIYRELFTVETFPRNDDEVLRHLFKAKMIGYILGVPQLRTKGDLTFSIDEMKTMQKAEESKFYSMVQFTVADRT
jgi:hypothetical protein